MAAGAEVTESREQAPQQADDQNLSTDMGEGAKASRRQALSQDIAKPKDKEIHRSTDEAVRNDLNAHRREICALKPGEVYKSPTGRYWEVDAQGEIYYNSQGEKDATYGRLGGPEWYVKNSGRIIAVHERRSGMSLNAGYYVDDDKNVYDEQGAKVKPDENGIYNLPGKLGDSVVKTSTDDFRRTSRKDGFIGWRGDLDFLGQSRATVFTLKNGRQVFIDGDQVVGELVKGTKWTQMTDDEKFELLELYEAAKRPKE